MNYILESLAPGQGTGQSLRILLCGHQRAGKGHTVPLRKYPQYSLTFVLKGCGTLSVGDRQYTVSAGEGFVIEKNSYVSYRADGQDPWEYIFIIFEGPESSTLLARMGVGYESPLFVFPQSETEPFLEKMLGAARKDDHFGYDVTGYFLLAVSRCTLGSHNKSHDRYAAQAAVFIENNYDRNITVAEIADHLFIDRTYLYRIFKNTYGISPKQYLLQYRLAASRALLEKENVTVSEAARRCGFFDHAHFYKAFKAQYGILPGQIK